MSLENTNPTSTDESASPAGESKRPRGILYYLVPAAAFFILWFMFAYYVTLCQAATAKGPFSRGPFIYALDDAYISMAIGRNIAEHHTWGVHAGEFSSLASSIAWVLLIAAAYCFTAPGAREMIPLALNFFFAAMLIALVWHIVWQRGIALFWCALTLLAVIFLTPIVPVAFTGLEHILQSLVMLGFVYALSQYLGDAVPEKVRRRAAVATLILAPCITVVRYEAIFALAVAWLVLMLRKRFRMAFGVVAVGVVPIVVAGLFFMAHGWPFFPTTLLLKGNADVPQSWGAICIFFNHGYVNYYNVPHLTVLLAVACCAFLLYGRDVLRHPAGVMAVLFVGTAVLHLEFASVNWFYRYEAYLVCMGIVTDVLLLQDVPWPSLAANLRPQWLKCVGLIVVLLFLSNSLLWRARLSHEQTPKASLDNFSQQYQMAQFLKEYYPNAVVAANDIGAINYYADKTYCLDLVGLSNLKIAKLRRATAFNSSEIDKAAKSNGAKIAVVYACWFAPYSVPTNWVKVGTWQIFNTVVAGYPIVTFYAVDPKEADTLRKNIEQFGSAETRPMLIRLENLSKKKTAEASPKGPKSSAPENRAGKKAN